MQGEPTFLFCLGATKAGTSWLYRHLLAHPECHFRTIKELHYFSMSKPRHFEQADQAAAARIAGLSARLAVAPDDKRQAMARQIADLQDWRAVLAKGRIDVPAYRAFLLQDAGAARLVGDVTPAYALMPVDRLRALADVAADSRFLYLIRDPLARLWSHVRMIATRTTGPEAFAEESTRLLERMLAGDLSGEGQGIAARGDYRGVIARLKQAYAPGALMIEFQENLITLPGVARLSEFLGLTPAAAAVERRVFEGRPLPVPQALRARALEWLKPQYDYVAALFPTLPEPWRANMEGAVA